jgi:hypothetical protein
LQSLALLLIGPLVNEEAHPNLALVRPYIAFEGTKRQQVEAIELDIPEMTIADMPSEHAGTRIVGRRLGKFAGTGNAAAADVEPITREVPFRDGVHSTPSANRDREPIDAAGSARDRIGCC